MQNRKISGLIGNSPASQPLPRSPPLRLTLASILALAARGLAALDAEDDCEGDDGSAGHGGTDDGQDLQRAGDERGEMQRSGA
jgi:hypothetical protein